MTSGHKMNFLSREQRAVREPKRIAAYKVLFVYPSLFMQTGIPLAIACLAGALKAKGIDVRVFDTYPYRFDGEIPEHEFRSTVQHSTRSVDYSAKGIFPCDNDMFDDLAKLVSDFKPDLIGMSAAESVYERGSILTRFIKKLRPDLPVIAGGVFPTLAPEIAIQEASVDMICTGEGESALVEICELLAEGRSCRDVKGVWVKEGNKVIRNERRIENLATLPLPDFHCFDTGTFLRPMQGNLFRTIPVEFSRGCPYQCSFCAEPALEKAFLEINQRFFRKKSMADIIAELQTYVREYQPEFFYFSSETFLAISSVEFEAFIDGYRSIGLPFWIQTRPETLTEDKIRRLKEVGLFWMSIGVEHGDEVFRTKILKRPTRNTLLFDIMAMLNKCDQGASLNFIVGLPFETRDLVMESIKLSRILYRLNPRIRCNIFGFTPFRGSELYDICVEQGFWDGSIPFVTETDVTSCAMIKHPHLSDDDIWGLTRAYPLYVYLPDEYQNHIPVTETRTPEGEAMFEKLNAIVGRLLDTPLNISQERVDWLREGHATAEEMERQKTVTIDL
ncbi:MAG: radical SAM protein [Proteobacteria bacterium]|nr:radical SAM protein [Pseudomonadota bacterium]